MYGSKGQCITHFEIEMKVLNISVNERRIETTDQESRGRKEWVVLGHHLYAVHDARLPRY